MTDTELELDDLHHERRILESRLKTDESRGRLQLRQRLTEVKTEIEKLQGEAND